MPFVEGESLRARLEREGPLPVDQALADRDRSGGRASLRARARGRAPGHQAGEHPAVGRPRPHRRLRGGEGARRGQRGRGHAHRAGRRDAEVHEPGAGGRRRRWTGGRTCTRSAACCGRCSPGNRRSTGRRRTPSWRARRPRRCRTSGCAGSPVPVDVESVIARAMAPLPVDRFETAGDFAAALKEPGLVGAATRRRRVRGRVLSAGVAIVAPGGGRVAGPVFYQRVWPRRMRMRSRSMRARSPCFRSSRRARARP